jgi:hypothetical protein
MRGSTAIASQQFPRCLRLIGAGNPGLPTLRPACLIASIAT